MHDPRRFGSLELAPDEGRLGPDALTVSLAELRAALAIAPGRSGTAAPLKARLMDQERLAGVGNLLADEILYRAGLAPDRRTPLTDDELRALHKELRATLAPAGPARWLTHGRAHGGACRRRPLPARRDRAAAARPWAAGPPTGARCTSTDAAADASFS